MNGSLCPPDAAAFSVNATLVPLHDPRSLSPRPYACQLPRRCPLQWLPLRLGRPDRSAIEPLGKALQELSRLGVDTHPNPTTQPPFTLQGSHCMIPGPCPQDPTLDAATSQDAVPCRSSSIILLPTPPRCFFATPPCCCLLQGPMRGGAGGSPDSLKPGPNHLRCAVLGTPGGGGGRPAPRSSYQSKKRGGGGAVCVNLFDGQLR